MMMSDSSAEHAITVTAPMEVIESGSQSKDKDPLLTFQSTDSNELKLKSMMAHKKKCLISVFVLVVIILAIIIVVVVIVALDVFSSSKSKSFKYDRYLIIISLDGFRAQYFENPNISSPNIHQIAENGVHIQQLIPVYPTLTFPNHYTIATGLYPGNHGIVSNSFWDPFLQKTFYMSSQDDTGEWFKGEPIWLTHRMAQNMDNPNVSDYKTATIFWVGSDHNCSGKGYPDYYLNYNYSYPFKKRMDNVLDLLRNGEYRLIMTYFEQPDSNGHTYGPGSVQVKQSIQQVDGLIGYLMEGIKEISMELYERTDIIITADHGMTHVSNDTVIHINDTVDFNLSDTDNFRIDLRSVALFVKLTETSNFTIADVVTRLSSGIIYPIDLAQIYDRETIPFEYKSGFNNRIPDVMVLIPVGYQFKFDHIPDSKQYWLNMKGNHGFDNTHVDMSALFVAQGPSFKKGFIKDRVDNIHLYELFCYLMGMQPSPNNGSIAEIKDILVNTNASVKVSFSN